MGVINLAAGATFVCSARPACCGVGCRRGAGDESPRCRDSPPTRASHCWRASRWIRTADGAFRLAGSPSDRRSSPSPWFPPSSWHRARQLRRVGVPARPHRRRRRRAVDPRARAHRLLRLARPRFVLAYRFRLLFGRSDADFYPFTWRRSRGPLSPPSPSRSGFRARSCRCCSACCGSASASWATSPAACIAGTRSAPSSGRSSAATRSALARSPPPLTASASARR